MKLGAFFFILLLGFVKQPLIAQEIKPISDTLKSAKFQPNPKKAALYSAVFPGLGQTYNKQYWKLPIIGVGITASIFFYNFNATHYNTYRRAYLGRIANSNLSDDFTGIYTTDNLKTLQDAYKKYLDMTVLLTAFGYALQIIDALTAAHLHNFDLSPNLSLKIKPIQQQSTAGLGISLNFH